MLLFSIYNFYLTVSSFTDENQFTNPPSKMIFTRNIPARLINEEKNLPGKFPADSILVSDFLLEINNKGIWDEPLFKLIDDSPGNMLKIKVASFKRDNTLEFEIPKDSFDLDKLDYLQSAVLVINTEKGGASDRAGIKPGDFIVSINGHKFKNAMEADSLMRSLGTSEDIFYGIRRDNDIFKVKVVLARFGIKLSLLAIFLSGMIYFATGFFIGLKRPRLKAARLISLALILVGFLVACSMSASVSAVYAISRMLLTFGAAVYGTSAFIHSSFYFPKEHPERLRNKWYIISPYVVGSAFFAYIIYWIFFDRMPNYFVVSANLILFGITLLYVVFLLLRFRKTVNKEERRLSRPVYYALTLNLIVIISISVMSRLNYWRFEQYSIVFSALIPLAYLYTIGRYRLLDIDLRMKRNTQYVVLSALWKGLIVLVFISALVFFTGISIELPNIVFTGTSVEILDRPLSHYYQEVYDKIIVVFLSFLAGFFLLKLGRKGLESLDKKYFRVKYDFKNAAADINEMLASKLSISELCEGLVEHLALMLKIKRVGVVVFKDGVFAQHYYGLKSDGLEEFTTLSVAELLESVKQFTGVVRIDYLPDEFKTVYHECRFRFLLPIKSKGNYVGIILIGEKLSEAAYNNEDFDFLSSLTLQAGVAIENGFLYEDLAEQERIKHELGIARKIQLASLPCKTPVLDGLDIAGMSHPAMEVGGDFYDYLNGVAGEITVVVGDVSGKGTSAALYMSKAQGIMRTLNEFVYGPGELLTKTNAVLYKYIEKSSFITVICARFNTKTRSMSLSRAGHLPLYYYKSSAKVIERIVPKGIVLGVSKGELFSNTLQQVEMEYRPGDLFVFVTDGVLEARNMVNEEFGEYRLMQLIMKNNGMSAEQLRNLIVDEVKVFARNLEQFDDLTVVVVRIKNFD